MQGKKLLTGSEVNTDIAISLYDVAVQNAKKNAEDGEKKIFSADEISVELEKLLFPIIMQYDLTNLREYERLEKLSEEWYSDSDVHKCAAVQQILINMLPTYKNIQQQQKIDNYCEASNNYKEYLESEIEKEVNKITDTTFIHKLYYCLINSYPDSDNSQDAISRKKKFIIAGLKNSIDQGEKKDEINQQLLGRPKLLEALNKLNVMKGALNILYNSKLDPDQKDDNFFLYLIDNKAILAKKRDTGFETFVKGLGVVAASIFGVGVGGYFAYKHLFGSNATKGKEYIRNVDLNKRSKPKSSNK